MSELQQKDTSTNTTGSSTSTTIAKEYIPIVIPKLEKNNDNEIVSLSYIDEMNITTLDEYKKEYIKSITNISLFWYEQAMKRIDWFTIPSYNKTNNINGGSLINGTTTWFTGYQTNVSYNCIDRHVDSTSNESAATATTTNNNNKNNIAMIWEGDEPNDIRTITFEQLLYKTCQIANTLLSFNVKKGDIVTIYMPMIPELPMTMLACARIGAVHSVVFAGFSAEALAQRVVAAKSKIIITADCGIRGGKVIHLKDIVNECRTKYNVESIIEHVLVWERYYDTTIATSTNIDPNTGIVLPATSYQMKSKDIRMDIIVSTQRPYCVPISIDSEDPLFILYTSGSTGKPKGLVHTTGGYSVFASFTAATTFHLTKQNNNNDNTSKNTTTNELFACVADCGWITGHTYVVYGPLLNGCTTFLFESTPVYPNAGRYWDMIDRHGITKFYTAPTAIRLLMKFGNDYPNKYKLNTLQVLGTVGEPINPEAWRWYYEIIGRSKCTIVDTYWQTETGGHIITNIPGITPMKPGSCTLPMFGIEPIVLDPLTGQEVIEPNTEDGSNGYKGVLAIKQPWPGMARTCLDDHERYMDTYLNVYKGYYYTGDSVIKDKDGYYFIIGRVDDVLNVSGHRIGTAEVESALVAHTAVAQAAVVGKPHDIKGTSIAAFVMLNDKYISEYTNSSTNNEDVLIKELKQCVKVDIGSFATPDLIIISPSLPMTRSGKIMRRILRKIVCNELDTLGDISTLADPSIVEILITKHNTMQKAT